MKRTIEIDDTLEDDVSQVKEEVRDDFIEYLELNPDIKDFDEYYQNQGCDRVHEICDSSTPIYYSDIDGLYYLYSDDFEESYKNAGFGDGTENNHKQVAIYCYLSDKAFEFQNELQKAFDNWDREETTLKEFVEELKNLEV